MHVLYVHQNFPAQFGHIAKHIVGTGGKATFVSLQPGGVRDGIECIQYKTLGGARETTHYCSRTFENYVWHADGVYRALKARPDVRPDVIVAHAGLASSVFLRELYPGVPVVGLFEFYYRVHHADSDMTFRTDLPWKAEEKSFLRSHCRNAPLLLELQNCQVGYCPTAFQKSCFPGEYQSKLRVIFDGVDRAVYHSHGDALRLPIGQRPGRVVGGVSIPADTKIVTYASRGFESMRGFDQFMKAAKIICEQRKDVVFLVAGDDRTVYGGDAQHLGKKTFKEWVIAEHGPFDLERIRFVGTVPPATLSEMLAASDLHIYLTVPFVLSWSMMNAMSCGAVVLGSRTAPVAEMIVDGQNGLLADFFSADEIAGKAMTVLDDPAKHRHLGEAAERMVAEKYSLEVCLPAMMGMYGEAIGK